MSTESLTWYSTCEDISDRRLADRACGATLELFRLKIGRAEIDAYTDFSKLLDDRLQRAEVRLREMGESQGNRDSGMRVALDAQVDEEWDLLRMYAPWSINVELFDLIDGSLIAIFHDCGASIALKANSEEIDELTSTLERALTFERLATPPPQGRAATSAGRLKRTQWWWRFRNSRGS